MEQITQRNYLFDTFRGLLIWSIPLSHFTRIGGDFSQGSLGGIIYITINVFVMQAFVFLSGYFSKKPERARESAFKTFLFPYIIFTIVFYLFRYAYFGNARLNFLIPPFALWFLFSVFFYRFFLKDYIKLKHLLLVSIAIYMFAGLVPALDDFMALGRTASYFTFFVMGYYCTKEHIEKIQRLKIWHNALLGIGLIGASYVLAFYVKVPVGFYLLKMPGAELGLEWYEDILMRGVVLMLALGWTVLMFNILPKSNNYLTYVGKNTMPIYIFHLFIRYIVETYGFYDGNAVVYYLSTWALATLCVIIFSSPPIAKLYDGFVDGLYNLYIWFKKRLLIPEKSN